MNGEQLWIKNVINNKISPFCGEYVINTATLCQILLELKKSAKTQCFRGNLLFCDIRLNYLFEN